MATLISPTGVQNGSSSIQNVLLSADGSVNLVDGLLTATAGGIVTVDTNLSVTGTLAVAGNQTGNNIDISGNININSSNIVLNSDINVFGKNGIKKTNINSLKHEFRNKGSLSTIDELVDADLPMFASIH